jgi:hypothetical protein
MHELKLTCLREREQHHNERDEKNTINTTTTNIFIFCFMTKVQFYFEKLLQIQQMSYRFLLYKLVVPHGLARLKPGKPGLLCWQAIWHDCSHARQSGATTNGPPRLTIQLARLVTPRSVARLPRACWAREVFGMTRVAPGHPT